MKNVKYGSPDIYEQNSVILFPLLILAKNNSKVPKTAKKQPKNKKAKNNRFCPKISKNA